MFGVGVVELPDLFLLGVFDGVFFVLKESLPLSFVGVFVMEVDFFEVLMLKLLVDW